MVSLFLLAVQSIVLTPFPLVATAPTEAKVFLILFAGLGTVGLVVAILSSKVQQVRHRRRIQVEGKESHQVSSELSPTLNTRTPTNKGMGARNKNSSLILSPSNKDREGRDAKDPLTSSTRMGEGTASNANKDGTLFSNIRLTGFGCRS